MAHKLVSTQSAKKLLRALVAYCPDIYLWYICYRVDGNGWKIDIKPMSIFPPFLFSSPLSQDHFKFLPAFLRNFCTAVQ